MFKNNKIILLVLVVIVAFAGYNYVFKKKPVSDNSVLAVDTPGGENEEDMIGRELLITLSKLKSLTLDDSFFKDPVFISLNDFSSPIVRQEVGRSNPFSPISSFSNQDKGDVSGDKKVKN